MGRKGDRKVTDDLQPIGVKAMKVIDLIERLKEYRQDARVVVQGYEGGYDDVSIIKEITIRPASNLKWYYGRYEKAPETSEQGEQAVLLFGRGRREGS